MARVINPYNFVPFEKAPDRQQPEGNERVNTGWIDVTITPRTSLIVPDGAHPDIDNEHKTFKFFRIGGSPAVPGSSIRGMIRSAFEAASNSCLPFLRDKEELTMRTPVCAAFKHRGLLRFNGAQWELYKVETTSENGKTFEGTCVGRITSEQLYLLSNGKWNRHENASGYGTGTLQFHKPPVIPSDSCYHIRSLRPDVVIKVWSAGDNSPYESMKASLEATTKDEKLNSGRNITHKALLKALEDAKKNTSRYVPVWYLQVGTEYFLSPSAIGRVHQRSWEEIMGEYKPCTDLEQLCPACRLFGTVEGGGQKGRVRFTDALYSGRPLSEDSFKSITLDILAEPKPTAYEFYLRRPDGERITFWNYNYYSEGLEPRGYEYKPLSGRLMPRGRKFYWHKTSQPAGTREPGNMNSTMEYLEPDGAAFSFRIYFDGITDTELRQLQWIINFGENRAAGDLCHKLGHAKPLGYGSVKLTIDSITLRTLGWENDTLAAKLDKSNVGESMDCPWGEPDRIKALLAMVNIKKTWGVPVAYPMKAPRPRRDGTQNPPTIYEWFSQNRIGGVQKTLPEPVDDDISLESYVSDEAASAAAQQAQQPAEETVIGTITAIKGIGITLKLDGLDAPGFFLNKTKVMNLKVGTKIVVKLTNGRKINDHGNYAVEYVKHC